MYVQRGRRDQGTRMPVGGDRDREHRGYPDVCPVLRLRWDKRREHGEQSDGSEREESPDDLRLESASVGAHWLRYRRLDPLA